MNFTEEEYRRLNDSLKQAAETGDIELYKNTVEEIKGQPEMIQNVLESVMKSKQRELYNNYLDNALSNVSLLDDEELKNILNEIKKVEDKDLSTDLCRKFFFKGLKDLYKVEDVRELDTLDRAKLVRNLIEETSELGEEDPTLADALDEFILKVTLESLGTKVEKQEVDFDSLDKKMEECIKNIIVDPKSISSVSLEIKKMRDICLKIQDEDKIKEYNNKINSLEKDINVYTNILNVIEIAKRKGNFDQIIQIREQYDKLKGTDEELISDSSLKTSIEEELSKLKKVDKEYADESIDSVKRLAEELAKLNPDANITYIGNEIFGGEPTISTEIKPEKLKYPQGFYYNDKNGITNKHNTKSGSYMSVHPEVKKAEKKKEYADESIDNGRKLAEELNRLNPDAKIIYIGNENTGNRPYISTEIEPENLKYPQGFYYNEKNGITNKHNTKSGKYMSVDVKVRTIEKDEDKDKDAKKPNIKRNDPGLSRKIIYGMVAGIGLGAGVYFLTGPVGVGVVALAGLVAAALAKKKKQAKTTNTKADDIEPTTIKHI